MTPTPERCGMTMTNLGTGEEEPCNRVAPSWRWYGEGYDHEPLLAPACVEHDNAAGERIHALLAEVDRLRAGIEALADRLEPLARIWQEQREIELSVPMTQQVRSLRDLLNPEETS